MKGQLASTRNLRVRRGAAPDWAGGRMAAARRHGCALQRRAAQAGGQRALLHLLLLFLWPAAATRLHRAWFAQDLSGGERSFTNLAFVLALGK